MPETSNRPRRRPVPLLPLANRGSVLAVGAQALRDALSCAFQAVDEIQAVMPATGLRHRSNVFTIGSTRVCVAAMDPVRFESKARAEPCLVIPFRGRLRFRTERCQCLATGGRTAVFCSGEPVQCEFGPCTALFVSPDPERLKFASRLASADPAGDLELQLVGCRATGFGFTRESAGTPALARLLEEISRALEQPEPVSLLGLEDLLYRWMGELLAACLNAGRVNRRPR
ncbi:MAG: hypothetical protein FJ164_11725 [Gammaproteobacteria bacterium]|nr:hypothetical protein [Gammaproteobacteria bacterium]